MSRISIISTDEILDGALTVFGRLGYRHTSMDAVATECGIARPTLYLRFSSKRDLFLAVGRRALDRVYAAAAAASTRDGSTAERLFRVLCAKLDYLESHVGDAARHGIAVEGGKEVAALIEEFTSRHRVLVVRLLSESKIPDPTTTADVLLDAVTGISMNAPDVRAARHRIRHLITFIAGDQAPAGTERKARS